MAFTGGAAFSAVPPDLHVKHALPLISILEVSRPCMPFEKPSPKRCCACRMSCGQRACGIHLFDLQMTTETVNNIPQKYEKGNGRLKCSESIEREQSS
jgi:hypothetical protein